MNPLQQAFSNLCSGQPSHLQPPEAAYGNWLTPPERAILEQPLSCSAISSSETVRCG